MGRPSTFDRAIAEEILAKIAQGIPLSRVCASDPRFPGPSTFRGWLMDDVDGITALSTRAYSIGHDAIAEECIEICDSEEDPNKARIRVDTRLRLLGKWAPKKYGERIQQDITHDVADPLAKLMREIRGSGGPTA